MGSEFRRSEVCSFELTVGISVESKAASRGGLPLNRDVESLVVCVRSLGARELQAFWNALGKGHTFTVVQRFI